MSMTDPKPHQRINEILLGPLERPALRWLAAHMPAWVSPDLLTGIGILGSGVTFISYALSQFDRNLLWLASLGLLINWFGDSLDGTLARYRHIERPRYGFFVDHTVDAFSQLLIMVGMGMSPYVSFEVACLALIAYLLVSVLVYVRTYVEGVFRISYGRFGPTEVRAIIILLNFSFYSWAAPQLSLPFRTVSVYDLIIALAALALFIIFIVSATQKALELARHNE